MEKRRLREREGPVTLAVRLVGLRSIAGSIAYICFRALTSKHYNIARFRVNLRCVSAVCGIGVLTPIILCVLGGIVIGGTSCTSRLCW